MKRTDNTKFNNRTHSKVWDELQCNEHNIQCPISLRSWRNSRWERTRKKKQNWNACPVATRNTSCERFSSITHACGYENRYEPNSIRKKPLKFHTPYNVNKSGIREVQYIQVHDMCVQFNSWSMFLYTMITGVCVVAHVKLWKRIVDRKKKFHTFLSMYGFSPLGWLFSYKYIDGVRTMLMV